MLWLSNSKLYSIPLNYILFNGKSNISVHYSRINTYAIAINDTYNDILYFYEQFISRTKSLRSALEMNVLNIHVALKEENLYQIIWYTIWYGITEFAKSW